MLYADLYGLSLIGGKMVFFLERDKTGPVNKHANIFKARIYVELPYLDTSFNSELVIDGSDRIAQIVWFAI